MKMPIVDLMDLYVDENAAELGDCLPPLPEIDQQRRNPRAPKTNASRFRKPFGIAASILIVLGVAGALVLGLGHRQTGGTLSPGETPPAVSQWGVVPSQGPDSASESEWKPEQEASQSNVDMQPEADKINPVLMEGLSSDYIERSLYSCDGNLFDDGIRYYTVRDGRVVEAEAKNISIDFYAYGDWNFSMDYIIAEDDSIALRDCSQNDTYFRISRIPGSSDTVMVTVRRVEESHVENCDYPVFYNIETGETMDPLANVPELFDHGNPSVIQVSPSRRWALVDCFEYVEDGESYMQTGHNEYLCNLETGAMVRLADVMQLDETQNLQEENAFWGSDDTLYVWFSEQTGEENVPYWMAAYTPESGTRGELHRCLNAPHTTIHTEARDYLGEFYDAGGLLYLLVTDAANGTQWTLTDVDLNGSTCWSEVPNRLVLAVGDQVYLVDEVEKGYVCLNDLLAMPEKMIEAITQQSENFLCIYTEQGCYCYALPEILETTPLIQWQSD